MNMLLKKLCSIGGADIDVLKECPNVERNKFLFTGIGIINASLLSALAGGVLLKAINNQMPFIFTVIGFIVWGWIMFNLNMLLSNMGLSLIPRKGIKKIVVIFFLLLLKGGISVVFSFSDSQPLEVIIFKKYLPISYRKQQIEQFAKLNAPKLEEENTKQAELNRAEEAINTWRVNKNENYSTDSILKYLTLEKEDLSTRYNELNTKNSDLNRRSSANISSAQNSIDSIQKDINIIRNSAFKLTEKESEEINSLENRKTPYIALINSENNNIRQRNNELNIQLQKVESKQREITTRYNILELENNRIMEDLIANKNTINNEKDALAHEASVFYKENEVAANIFTDDNFINNTNAIKYIESWKKDPDTDIKEKQIAERVTEIRWLIIFIFLIVDVTPILAPILMGIFIEGGVYENLKRIKDERIIFEQQTDLEESKKIILDSTSKNKQKEIFIKASEQIFETYKYYQQIITKMNEDTINGITNLTDKIMSTKLKDDNEIKNMQTKFENILHSVCDNTQNNMKNMFDKMQDNYKC